MKFKLLPLILFLFATSLAFGQERVLKSETILENQSKSDAIKTSFPKISVNNNKCRFNELSIRKSGISQAEITFYFERPCDGHKSVSLVFNDLEEALMVRELLMTNRDYSMFNIVSEKEKKPIFELQFN